MVTEPGQGAATPTSHANVPHVFVSHSQRDDSGTSFLRAVFDSEGSLYRPLYYSFLPRKPPHAPNLLSQISASPSLIVLLSPDVGNSAYTRSWVGFEVGVAAKCHIPIIVIESEESPGVEIPIPGANIYLRRPEVLTKIHPEDLWDGLARTGGASSIVDGVVRGGPFSEHLAKLHTEHNTGVGPRGPSFRRACSNEDCHSQFLVWPIPYKGRFPCPVCRAPQTT
jgi:hypothetical protein